MRRITRTLLPAVGFALAGTAAHAQYNVYGITTGNGGAQQLVRFNSANPMRVTTLGLTGASLTGLDFRPATGMLYGYNGSQLFTVNLRTGAATQVATVSSPTGANVGFDFNPTVDRIRIVDAAGANRRVNPVDGVAIQDGAYAYAPGDVSTGAPAFSAVAYTNSDTDPATGTTLYGVDGGLGNLVEITAPNGGLVNTVGSLGFGFSPTIAGFDILTVGGMNLAYLSAVDGNASRFYRVNLETGAASLVGNVRVAGGLQGIAVGTAVVPEPSTWALMATGLAGLVVGARRRRAAAK